MSISPVSDDKSRSLWFEPMLEVANPWWKDGSLGARPVEDFHRPIFYRLYKDLSELKQILSITGPRRIGKTTILLQTVRKLLADGVSPHRILYFSLDDPALSAMPEGRRIIDELVGRYFSQGKTGSRYTQKEPVYIFLDEVQRFERWEQFLKKYYDLGYPIRWMITGSASSPILRKSHESLLGRIKEYHILPFSFREFALYRHRKESHFQSLLDTLRTKLGASESLSMLEGSECAQVLNDFVKEAAEIRTALASDLQNYLLLGGFPEVWEIPDLPRRQEYLWDNQVQKVIFEDLFYTAAFRKPENIKRFYLYLITRPGDEIQVDAAAREIGASRLMLEKYLPLLEMTNLVKTVQRFSKKPLRVKRSFFKCYPVDLALRNAVLKLSSEQLQDPALQGRYAEDLVFVTLFKRRDKVELSYYRDRDKEIDFVVSLDAQRFLPVEVKYSANPEIPRALSEFLEKNHQTIGLLVKKDGSTRWAPPLLEIPLLEFLLLFD